ncbi:MAG: hypothetical protein VKO65_03880 [Cyanobacteriota bacterium]|nr:hypothetical protein [Cyanobacteriota bacterium]
MVVAPAGPASASLRPPSPRGRLWGRGPLRPLAAIALVLQVALPAPASAGAPTIPAAVPPEAEPSPAAWPAPAPDAALSPAAIRDSLAPLIGRWQGQSTAGMAVLEVLTITPRRVRWGNAYNGRCDSAYSAEVLPSGRGTYPDNLTPPLQPSELDYRVVRLTLRPGPCPTGDAVLQLAMPRDGSDRIFVNSYGRDGQLTGWYGELNRLP